MKARWTVVVAGIACLVLPATAAPAQPPKKDCPKTIKDAAIKAHPGSSLRSCHQEMEEGTLIYEVALTTKGGKAIEVEVNAEGSILETEESIDLGEVPKPVMLALTARYPGATALSAEKITLPDGTVHFEVEFEIGKATREATFTAAGGIVEEEGEDDHADADEGDDD